ncbi:hypothetical protein PR202_gb28447 [Eleusine coracana subsp. coracana]|uniref:B box-type domain-containing protein n=1 Tax=Eleusine coracana subsp. coracana TaxID=191504 RepID=A0AAV5FWZ7_ELECO|nr:hypothetical protein QOZ80_6AG0550670 [Eleusine coracana subsp. coracana]GJN39336.1 hypothetical protein PR202_gb28447 [Eleusine coracana subsp. coracana]
MRVNCDVCGGEPAAVLCCADEAALCSACDRRVHRANKLAGKHRRIPLVHHPSGDDEEWGPLCDVCKERRGLVFCVEDRAILCPDCDEPIHTANELTAKHTRFLLVGAKLSSNEIIHQESDGGVSAAAAAACCAQQDDPRTSSSVVDNNNGDGGAMIVSDYLTNICPGWRVDDLLFDESPFSAPTKPGCEEQVPSMDADLFDVVAGRQQKRGAWTVEEVPTTNMAVPAMAAAAKQDHRVIRGDTTSYWNTNIIDNDSDVFAVPEITPPPAKKARPSSYWCF